MKILLTEKEIDAILDDWGKNPEGRQYDNEVAKAQLKKVGEWGNEPCSNHWKAQKRRECKDCWQTLLKEVEGE